MEIQLQTEREIDEKYSPSWEDSVKFDTNFSIQFFFVDSNKSKGICGRTRGDILGLQTDDDDEEEG